MSDERIVEKLKERKSIFIDATRGQKKPKRIPLLNHAWTYKIFDAGYKLSDCLFDYEKAADATYKFQERYNFDANMDIGFRNPVKMLSNFDADVYTLDDENDNLYFLDRDSMSAPDDLKLMCEKGYYKFTYENILVNKYNVKNSEDGIKRMVAAAKEFAAFGAANGKTQQTMIDKYAVPALCKGRYDIPCEVVFSAGLRGIKSFSLDMRRYPDLLEDMFDVMNNATIKIFEDALDTFVDDERMIFPVRQTCLAHTIMSPKQFERFYWPALKYYGDTVAEHDVCAFMFVEGSIAHVYDYYRELAPNRILILMEQDDPYEFKEKLPNLCPCGGFPIELLSAGTPEQNIEKAKEMVDKMAYDGRWVYAANKMISFRNDARPENLKAVNDYLLENGVY